MTMVRVGAVILMLCVSLAARGQDAVYSFGVVPQQSATKLAGLWGPVLQLLSARSGVKLRFATAPDIPTFEERVARAEYDFAYMNPYHFVTFSADPGYRALAHARNRRIRGIMVVRRGSPLARLEDLSGSELAFPAPRAFAATLLTQARLRELGVAFRPAYVASHDSVYRAVAKGLYPAGGGIMRTLNNVAPDVRAQLRVLWTSDGFTPHAFASRPDLPSDVRDRVARAMYTLHEDGEGLRRLRALGLDGLRPATDDAWDDVRALGLTVQ